MRTAAIRRGFMLLAVAAALLSAGCSRSVDPPAQDVVAANPGQFAQGLAISVTAGSTGREGSPTSVGQSWWWLDAPNAIVTATNNGPAVRQARVSATLAAPACVKQASLQITVGTGPKSQLAAAKTGTAVSLPIAIGTNAEVSIQISVLTPPCRVAGDSRTLYLQLIGLTIK